MTRLESKDIDAGIQQCPSLPSLGSISKALERLVFAEQRYSSQVSEFIRRDPSLTSRLLRLVNSVYYGLANPVNSIEEAVFYLGVRQIRQLITVTPIIEDFQKLTGNMEFLWREFWQHSIGTAILTREIMGAVRAPIDESDYIAGLVHDVGKIVMASAFPDHFSAVHREALLGQRDLLEIENEILGIDHAELGARYLERQRLSDLLVMTARFHHRPEAAPAYQNIIASVQLADLLMRSSRIGCSGNFLPVTSEQCLSASGLSILFRDHAAAEHAIERAALQRSLERLPHVLEGLV